MEIILQFLTFDLEHDPLQVGEGDCKYDWLDIWDGIPHGEWWCLTRPFPVASLPVNCFSGNKKQNKEVKALQSLSMTHDDFLLSFPGMTSEKLWKGSFLTWAYFFAEG